MIGTIAQCAQMGIAETKLPLINDGRQLVDKLEKINRQIAEGII